MGDACYLVDQFREQADFADLRDNLRRFCKAYRPVAILIERAANGHALISDLSRKSPRIAKLVVPVELDGRSSPHAFACTPRPSLPSVSIYQLTPRGGTTSLRSLSNSRMVSLQTKSTPQRSSSIARRTCAPDNNCPGRHGITWFEQRRSDKDDHVPHWGRTRPHCRYALRWPAVYHRPVKRSVSVDSEGAALTRYAVQCPPWCPPLTRRWRRWSMRCVHNDRLTGLGHDHAILGVCLFFRFPLFVDKFSCQRAAKRMNSRRFPRRGYWSSDEIPCFFPLLAGNSGLPYGRRGLG